MPKLEQIRLHSASAAPYEVGRRDVAMNMIVPSRQTSSTTEDNAMSFIGDDRKVIGFRSSGAGSRQKSGLRESDRTSDSNVISFRSRGHTPRPRSGLRRWDTTGESPVKNVEKYDPATEDDDYRHRMLQNALATIVLAVLVISGHWIVSMLVSVT